MNPVVVGELGLENLIVFNTLTSALGINKCRELVGASHLKSNATTTTIIVTTIIYDEDDRLMIVDGLIQVKEIKDIVGRNENRTIEVDLDHSKGEDPKVTIFDIRTMVTCDTGVTVNTKTNLTGDTLMKFLGSKKRIIPEGFVDRNQIRIHLVTCTRKTDAVQAGGDGEGTIGKVIPLPPHLIQVTLNHGIQGEL
jgi:hypothetical protein